MAPRVRGRSVRCWSARSVREAARGEFGFDEQNRPCRRLVEASHARHIGEICAIGDEGEVARRLPAFRDAGMTNFLAVPGSVEGGDWSSTAERLAAIEP